MILRPWRRTDREPFAELNVDPDVMRHYPSIRSWAQSDATADRIEAHFEEFGFGLWAAELPGFAPFIGFIGLQTVRFEAPFSPCVEIGWFLDSAYWYQGLATEGARAAADYAFETLDLGEIVAFTLPANAASRRVMTKLGMERDPAYDFDHPDIPPGSPFSRHLLYRLQSP